MSDDCLALTERRVNVRSGASYVFPCQLMLPTCSKSAIQIRRHSPSPKASRICSTGYSNACVCLWLLLGRGSGRRMVSLSFAHSCTLRGLNFVSWLLDTPAMKCVSGTGLLSAHRSQQHAGVPLGWICSVVRAATLR